MNDPHVLDFLAFDGDATDRYLEQALDDRIIDTLRGLGEGFAFVGRQVHFDVDGDDFSGDLLPECLGQLGFHVALVDEKLRRPHHADTVGLLLVADKNVVVRYSLAGQRTPIGVSNSDLLPPTVRAALPSGSDLAAALMAETEPDPRDVGRRSQNGARQDDLPYAARGTRSLLQAVEGGDAEDCGGGPVHGGTG
jgi:hypothetical protein